MTYSLSMKACLVVVFSCFSFLLLNAQEEFPYLKGEFYFKLIDDYPIQFNSRTPQVDIAEQIPFFKEYTDFFDARVISSFYFAEQDRFLRTFRVKIADEQLAEQFMEAIQAEEEVESVERILAFTTNGYVPDDVHYESQWYLQHIRAEEAWDMTLGNEEIIVAVVDNGFYGKHLDLLDKWVLEPGADVANFDDDPFVFDENYWHGTHVAGIVGADSDSSDEGVASIGFNTKIMPVKATCDAADDRLLDHCEYDPALITSGYEGIVWAINNGANIINVSWGRETSLEPEKIAIYYPTMESVFLAARNENILIVAAAGNNDSDTFFYPAAHPTVLAVANTDSNDKKALSSNYGDWVNIAAPGEEILSTFPSGGYEMSSGTSMSSPLVTGVAALMLSIYPDMTPDQIIKCLTATAYPISDTRLGAGRVDAEEALHCTKALVDEIAAEEEEERQSNIISLSISPNPMKKVATIDYELRHNTKVYVDIYNQWGYSVYSQGPLRAIAGVYQFTFYRSSLRRGTYFCRVTTSTETKVIKFLIID